MKWESDIGNKISKNVEEGSCPSLRRILQAFAPMNWVKLLKIISKYSGTLTEIRTDRVIPRLTSEPANEFFD